MYFALCQSKAKVNFQKLKPLAILLRGYSQKLQQDPFEEKLDLKVHCLYAEMIPNVQTKPLGRIKVAQFNLMLLGSQP